MVDLTHVTWHKSSYSAQEGQCLEVADGISGGIPVRDSKNPDGPALIFPAEAWRSFLSAVRAGEFGTV
nr:DUF397 domain-containing protein [Kitasatospora purpeofusca]